MAGAAKELWALPVAALARRLAAECDCDGARRGLSRTHRRGRRPHPFIHPRRHGAGAEGGSAIAFGVKDNYDVAGLPAKPDRGSGCGTCRGATCRW